MNVNNWNPNFFIQNKLDCLNYIKETYHSVPYVNANDLQYIKQNSIVRFRGMVQDMFDPEYYLEKCEVINCITKEKYTRSGQYTDIIQCNDNEVIDEENENNISGERQAFVGISVPSMNDWVKQIETKRYKLKIDANEQVNFGTKRPINLLEDSDTADAGNIISHKRLCASRQIDTTQSVASNERLLNYPMPDEASKTCHLMIYEADSGIKLNEVYDFVGFLSNDVISRHTEASADLNSDLDDAMEIETHNPPTSFIPRIHCIFWSKVKHVNCLADNITMDTVKMQSLRKELHSILTEVLLGDELAADYLLYHLLSRVHLRRDLMPLGSFTLNISNIPPNAIEDYGEKLYHFIEMLLPQSHYLPMTLENMNNLNFTPKKDYTCDRLTSGLLQLSEGTHLVLDETKLSVGKLNEGGVKALSAINDIIKSQKVDYDFGFYKIEYECDIPILIVSEGKSLLPSDSYIVLKPKDDHVRTFEEIIAVKVLLKPGLLNDLRVYLTLARNQQYEINENMLEIVQNDFVTQRQSSNITAEDLHLLLVLSRLVCTADGKSVLDEKSWKTACEMEKCRKARI